MNKKVNIRSTLIICLVNLMSSFSLCPMLNHHHSLVNQKIKKEKTNTTPSLFPHSLNREWSIPIPECLGHKYSKVSAQTTRFQQWFFFFCFFRVNLYTMYMNFVYFSFEVVQPSHHKPCMLMQSYLYTTQFKLTFFFLCFCFSFIIII